MLNKHTHSYQLWHLQRNFGYNSKFKRLLLLGIIAFLCQLSFTASGQIRNKSRNLPPQDSLATRQDTISLKSDTLQKKGDIETQIKYDAKDSIVTDVAKQITRLYKDAKVTYGEITLEAAYMEVDMRKSEVYAIGIVDSTGKMQGVPKFKNGAEEYEAKGLRYNFKSRRARINQIVTQQGEGFVHGKTVKKDQENNMYVGQGLYTTCNLEHPHFHINAPKIKVVHDKQIVTGPFNLVINDVPTPLGFAFGVFPFVKKKPNGTSGIIFPVYGEEPKNRGFFLRQGGYYWAASDKLNMSFLGEIYSKGGWGLNVLSQYRKLYSYTGNLDVRFNRNKYGDEGFQNTGEDFWINWSHSPESKGTSRFSASVNAGTTSYNQRNSFVQGGTQDLTRQITPQFMSNVSYSNSAFNNAVTYGVNLRQSMNVQTGVMDMTLPDVNLSLTRIYPFKKKNSTGKSWYETIGFSYSLTASNKLSNSPRTTADSFNGLDIANASPNSTEIIGFNPSNSAELWRRAEIGAKHTIPVSMSLKLFKYFSVSPSFSYNETWYPQKLSYTYIPEIFPGIIDSVRIDTARGFARSYSYNASVGLTTNIYGMFNFSNEKRRLQTIRHRMIPNVSFSYAPDFSRDQYGFYQDLQIGRGYTSGYNRNPELYRRTSRFPSSSYGAPGRGESGSISFSLNNTLEAKMRAKSDSAGAKSEKVTILDNFNISSSYNLAADSFNLAPFNIGARTKILKTDVNFSMVVDPYTNQLIRRNENGSVVQRKLNEFSWNHGKGLGQITSANMYFSKSFSPGSDKKKGEKTEEKKELTPEEEDQLKQINANRDMYVDFNIPWTLSFSYSLNYNKRGYEKAVISQVLTFNGDLKLTDKWKIAINSGYDFVGGGITNNTSINIHRDLHCWEMVASWIPFGLYQSYTFDLKVKASLLQDLKLSRRRTWADRSTSR